MRARAAVLALLLACSKSSPPTPGAPPAAGPSPEPSPSAERASPSASADAPAPPPLAVASAGAGGTTTPQFHADTAAEDPWEWGLRQSGFPALSVDGKRLAYFVNEAEGARGLPNHRFYLKNVATDKDAAPRALFEAAFLEKLGEGRQQIELARRRVAANAAKTRAALGRPGAWQAMATATGEFGGAFRAGDLTVELRGARLVVRDGEAVLVDRALTSRKPRRPAGKGAPGVACAFEPRLDAVHVAMAQKVVAATIVYREAGGGEACKMPDEVHAVRLP
jgi:hypothetical protein